MTAHQRRPMAGAFSWHIRLRRSSGLLAAGVAVLAIVTASSHLVAAAASGDVWASPSGGNGNAMTNAGEATITGSNAGRMVRAWTASAANSGPQAPTVVAGVVYYLHSYRSTTDPDTLVAASTRTGNTLWRVALSRPNQLFFDSGVTVSGHLALISFQNPAQASAGLMAVDLTSHRIAWTRAVASGSAQDYAWSGHQVYVDGSRAYVHLSDYTLSAYRLSDGTLQWTVRLADNLRIGIALDAGRLYVGYDAETPGITAYEATTGRRLWTGPGQGTPVVAGGRVFATASASLMALNAAGCGRTTCPALWTKIFPAASPKHLLLGSADATTLFVTYQRSVPADRYGDTYAGVIARLSAATGAQQWSASTGAYLGPPVRGGTMVWVDNEYRDSAGALKDRLLGFAAVGTAASPRAGLAAAQSGIPQTLAIGGGTLFEQTNIYPGLVAYRVPGT